ncbi:MAG TPA: DUF2092 domain-containing protein, partial [Draconibacterium sp.]|nr:DUF2092 domain-containing protein [Draconibacterium sp.]
QATKPDTTAVMILDQMSYVIGDLHSASFTVNVKNDVIDREVGLVSQYSESEVILDGPDKMQVHTKGGKGHLGYWYNGELLVYYSFDENNFVLFDALPTTLQTIDSINTTYGIDFPAADFLYPTFTDDLIANSTEIIFNGRKMIAGKECFHIISHGEKSTIQFWISSDAFTLPVKMLIIDHTKNPGLQYEATFSDWQLNKEYPASIFEFLTPPGAHEINILPKSKK